MSFPTYDLSFNYAAVGVYLVLMISYICKKRAEMWETTLFIVLLSVSFLSTVADILCSYAHMHLANFSQLFTYATTVAYFVFHNTTSCCFAVYIISMSEKNYLTLPFWKKVLFLLPICIIIALVCVSCITGSIFYFDSDGVYHRGPLQIVLYIVSAFFIHL